MLGPNFAVNPATGRPFVVEPHFGGQASSVRLLDVVVGRLVDVYDRNPATGARTLRFVDLLIGQDIASDGLDFELEQQPVTHKSALTVLHAFGSAGFAAAFPRLEAGLQPLLVKSFAPSELPPFSPVPRNGALAIRCDDLLDDGGDPGDPGYPGTIRQSNVHVVSGVPPVSPFEARVLPDPNHGDLVAGQFHSTRILVDLAVSPLESQASGTPVNLLGLPEALTTALANAGLRLPTQVNPAAQQLDIVRNLGGAGFAFVGNGATDPTSFTLDVVRAFRSGGSTQSTGDPFNGFLADSVPPSLLAILDCNLTKVTATTTPNEFRVTVRFPDPDCESRIHVGDLIETSAHLAEVVQAFSTSAKVRLLSGNPATFSIGPARFTTPWVPAQGLRPECAVRFSPPAGNGPNKKVAPSAGVIVSFSEPIRPESVRAFDTFTVTRMQWSNPLTRYIVGRTEHSFDLLEYRFLPDFALTHVAGQGERYLVNLDGSVAGITDLAGNPLLYDPPQTNFTLDPAVGNVSSNGFALRFDSTDEDGDTFPELRGQLFYDLTDQLVRPRAVTRFSHVADTSVPTVGVMIPINAPIQTPLSDKGSKMMGVWRYHDLGFGLLDDSTHNLDIEGLSWTLYFSSLFPDHFSRFQMSFAHSKYLPDEELSSSLLPNWPASGLVGKFEDNLLDKTSDPLTVVHSEAKGYTVGGSPGETFYVPTSGFTMAHWPLNRGIPLDQYTYWTWRDTATLAAGGLNGDGVDTGRLLQVTKLGNPGFYSVGKVPTIGLPLLMEYRTWPDTNANGSNGLRIAIAINSSASPYFRAYSTGGVLQSGQVITVNPDTAVTATGGINPATGLTTFPRDNVLYYGQADFVVRVSRAHSVWFDTLAASTFAQPAIDYGPNGQPAGTQIHTAFRGASSITANAATPGWRDASNLDPYGDGYNATQLAVFSKPATLAFTPSFYNNPPAPTDKRWHANITEINGARFIQARISFVGNPITDVSPQLSSLGVAFQH